jgi:UDP-GlcNAc:undecaprenyl-phosphate GlcNAc-1-phosphate transferase
MISLTWYQCIAVFATTTLVTLVLTPFALRLALRRGIVDRPDAIKLQSSPVPYLGGLAIVLAFSLVVVGAALVDHPYNGIGLLAVVLGTGLGLSILGVIDDIWTLGPWIRLFFEAGAGVIVWVSGTRVEIFAGHFRGGRAIDAVITVVWVVGITNAFNILDNMDGLSAGIAAIASLGLFVVAYTNGQYLVAVLALALVGCAVGFLRHNFHPATIYMGDAGSLYLGFLLSVLCLRLRTYEVVRISFIVPILLLGVAIFDTVLVSATRILNGRNPFAGGRDHTSHRLVFLGFSVKSSVALIYAAGVASAWLAIIASRIDRPNVYLLGGLALAMALFFGILLARLPIYAQQSSKMPVPLHQETPSSPDVDASIQAASDPDVQLDSRAAPIRQRSERRESLQQKS